MTLTSGNIEFIRAILNDERSARRDIVLLYTAAVLVTASKKYETLVRSFFPMFNLDQFVPPVRLGPDVATVNEGVGKSFGSSLKERAERE
jgi:hypothetical protein